MPIPFGLNVPWAWPWVAAILFLLLSAELFALSREQRRKQLPALPVPLAFSKALPLVALLLAVQLWVLAQWLSGVSLSPFDTRMNLSLGVSYLGFLLLCLLLINTSQRAEQVIWVLVFSAAFQAVFGAVMVLTGTEWGFLIQKESYLGKATGTFINRNHLAGYLEMTIALGIGLLLAQVTSYSGNWRQRLRSFIGVLLSNKVILRLLLVIMVIALVMTRSRMGNTAFFASMMATGLLALLIMRNKSLSTTILLGSLLAIDIAIVGTFFGVEEVAERLQNTSTETESRDEVTRDTVQMAKDHALTGTGAGTFTHVYPAFKGADVVTTFIYNNAHNDYAQFAAEFGLPAAAVLLLVVLICLWWAVSAMRQRNSHFYQGLGFGSAMAIIAIGIHSAVDFNLQIPANVYTFILVLALATIARWAPRRS